MVAVTALVMAATPAFAADWIYVCTSKGGSVYYYDADTIQRSANQVTVWEKSDHSRDKTSKWREAKDRYRYDCAERTGVLLDGTSYYPDGKIETHTFESYEQKARSITPDTVEEAQFEAVCAATAP